MSKALPGENYCVNHQGNFSHYDEKNCTVCKLERELAECRKECEEQARLNGMGASREAALMAMLTQSLSAAERRLGTYHD